MSDALIESLVRYSCSSCPVDDEKPGTCDVCGRTLTRTEPTKAEVNRARRRQLLDDQAKTEAYRRQRRAELRENGKRWG